jgi:hypothetical protein
MTLSIMGDDCYARCRYAKCHYAECHYAECHYAECYYAECHYAESRGDGATLTANDKVCQFQTVVNTPVYSTDFDFVWKTVYSADP